MTHLRRPLVLALLTFLVGLSLGLRFRLPSLPIVLGAVVLCLILVLRAQRWIERTGLEAGLIHLLFALTGVATGTVAAFEAAADCRGRIPDGAALVARATLATAHRPAASPRQPLVPLIEVELSGPFRCRGEIRARLPKDAAPLPPASHVLVSGSWRAFGAPLRSSDWPRDPRFHGYLAVDSVTLTETPSRTASPALLVRRRADAALARLFPRHLEMVEALLLGRREHVDSEVRDRFARAGLSHLLAISGMHVGLLAGALLVGASAIRLSRRRAVSLTLLSTWAYLFVIGAPASAIRAGTMISLALLARLLQRPSAALPMMAAAAFAILLLRPLALIDPGFQLSFAGVLGILLLRPALLTLAPDGVGAPRPWRTLWDAFLVGIAAFVATAPIVAHHFGTAAPISILAGLPAVPLMSLALVGTAASLLILPVAPAGAELIAAGAAGALDLLDAVAAAAATVPLGNGPVSGPDWPRWVVAATAGAVAGKWGTHGGGRRRWTAGIGVTLALFAVWPLIGQRGSSGLEIHFLDVGQGDAVAIRTPGRRWVLVDAGPADQNYDAGERRVLPFLRERGARRLEALILTHPHLDHIGGAPAILRALPVGLVLEPGLPVGSSSYHQILDLIESRGVQWGAARSGRVIELDGVRLEFLWPDAETVDGAEDANQISAVVRLVYGEFALLLPGDIGAAVEDALVRRDPGALRAPVLKLGHHGSDTSTSEAWLDAVTPDLAVVSAGRRNRYGHPDPAVIERLNGRGITVARTDREGDVTLFVPPGGTGWVRKER